MELECGGGPWALPTPLRWQLWLQPEGLWGSCMMLGLFSEWPNLQLPQTVQHPGPYSHPYPSTWGSLSFAHTPIPTQAPGHLSPSPTPPSLSKHLGVSLLCHSSLCQSLLQMSPVGEEENLFYPPFLGSVAGALQIRKHTTVT